MKTYDYQGKLIKEDTTTTRGTWNIETKMHGRIKI